MSVIVETIGPRPIHPGGGRLSEDESILPGAHGLADYLAWHRAEFPLAELVTEGMPSMREVHLAVEDLDDELGGLVVGWLQPDGSVELEQVWCSELAAGELQPGPFAGERGDSHDE